MNDFDPTQLPDDLRPPAPRRLDKGPMLESLRAEMDREPGHRRAGRWIAPLVAASVLTAGVLAYGQLMPRGLTAGETPAPTAAPTPTGPVVTVTASPTPTATSVADPTTPAPSPTTPDPRSTPDRPFTVPKDSEVPATLDVSGASFLGAELGEQCLTAINTNPSLSGRFQLEGISDDGTLAVLADGASFTVCSGTLVRGYEQNLDPEPMYLSPAPITRAAADEGNFEFSRMINSWEYSRVPKGNWWVSVFAGGPMKGLESVSYDLTALVGGDRLAGDPKIQSVGDYWVMSDLLKLPADAEFDLDVTATAVTSDGQKAVHRFTPEKLHANPEAECRHENSGC